MNQTERTRVIVTGRVQGVGFRYYTEEKATRFVVTGFVRNLPDRTVEIEVEGAREEIDRFLAEVRIGPPGSRVDRLTTEPMNRRTGEKSFRIRY